jgi:hypothetical protein
MKIRFPKQVIGRGCFIECLLMALVHIYFLILKCIYYRLFISVLKKLYDLIRIPDPKLVSDDFHARNVFPIFLF